VATFKEQSCDGGSIPDGEWPPAISWSELDALHARIGRHFARAEPRQRALSYLHGLLAPLERKNGRSLALYAAESRADGMQRLLSQAKWSSDAVRDELQDYVAEQMGDGLSTIALAETTFEKRGNTPAGVASHFDQTAGRFVRSQLGVFLIYQPPGRAATFVDRRLYLPPSDRSEATTRTRVPARRPTTTKSWLAQDMLVRARQRNLQWCWVTGSDAFGSDSALRDWLEAEEMPYLLEISSALRSLDDEDRAKVSSRLATLTSSRGGVQWYRPPSRSDNVDGPPDEWLRLPLSKRPGSELVRCLLLHRTKRRQALTCHVCLAPPKTPLPTLISVVGSAAPIDVAFQLARRCAGLDQYQVRGEQAWYRHVTLAMVAYAFLTATVWKDGELLTRLQTSTDRLDPVHPDVDLPVVLTSPSSPASIRS
jgi:SRSO17 transposase